MKRSLLTSIIGITAISLLAGNCAPKRASQDDLPLGLALSNLIRTAGSGNCAVSLNLATLYSGAIIQNAVNTATIFTPADFQAATGTTVGAGQTYTTYGEVPYNVRYDAFIRGGGTYDATARTADINSAKALTDLVSLAGISAVSCASNPATPAATLQGATTQFFGTFSPDEQVALNGAVPGVNSTVINAALGAGCVALASPPWTSFGGATATAGAFQARQAFANGAAILACGRIPRSSCTFAGLTTADRTTDIRSRVEAINAVMSNSDCRKTDADFASRMIRNSFVGVPRGTQITGVEGRTITTNPIDPFIAVSEGGTAPSNRIFAESAYPVSGALSTISTNFNVAFPMSTGIITQAGSTIPYYRASNIGLVAVESCEAVGLPSFGTSATAITGSGSLAANRELTPVTEIAYAFSPLNAAATLYAATRGAVQGTVNEAGLDAVACNNSFRSRFAIPVAIGGGRLGELKTAISGNGGVTSTLNTCVYGGTVASRTMSVNLLASVVPGIASCPAGSRAAAVTFGDTGVNTLADFPNN